MLHHHLGLVLGEAGDAGDGVKQVATAHQLQHQVHVVYRLDVLHQLDDVRVVELLHDADLRREVVTLEGDDLVLGIVVKQWDLEYLAGAFGFVDYLERVLDVR